MDPIFEPVLGRLYVRFPGAEVRPGQRHMAELVHDAIEEGAGRYAVWRAEGAEPDQRPGAVIQAIEAGTGTGKSLGYLLPALLAAPRPVIVATRTKPLQHQLLDLDLPRAEGILDRAVKAVVAKGRSNYLCRLAFDQMAARGAPGSGRGRRRELEGILSRLSGPWDGDREGLDGFGEGESETWDHLCARSERCIGRQCPMLAECYLTRLRQELAQADLIIANHALLLADRALRESSFGQVLPDAPVLVVDEAHELEEQLTDSCSEAWSSRAMALLLHDLKAATAQGSEGVALLARLRPWEEA